MVSVGFSLKPQNFSPPISLTACIEPNSPSTNSALAPFDGLIIRVSVSVYPNPPSSTIISSIQSSTGYVPSSFVASSGVGSSSSPGGGGSGVVKHPSNSNVYS